MARETEPAHSDCEHRWYWRRRRNQGFGYWDRVPLDEHGRAALTPEEALAMAEAKDA